MKEPEMISNQKPNVPHPGLMTIHEALDRNFDSHLERCRSFLRQPSISPTGEGIRETAEIVRSWIDRIGGQAQFWGRPDYPIVWGHLDVGAPRTLIIYGMYDVQPVEEDKWLSPPFAAEVRELPGLGPCVIARGAVNSKGALCGVFNVLEAMNANGGIPLNLIFTIEGEEEIGSPQFEDFILAHKDELGADGVADFDFSQNQKGQVDMHLGLKGIVYLDIICRGNRKGGPIDTSTHGCVSAWISSPVWRLVHALGTLTNQRERIQVKGIYDNMVPPNSEDMKLLRKLESTLDEKAFLREMKSLSFKNKRGGLDLLKKALYEPVMNINGIQAGYGGAGTKTILPRKAKAKIDVRFGPNLEPEEVVDKIKRHFAEQGYDDFEIIVRDSYSWSKTNFNQPIVQNMVQTYRFHGLEPRIWPMATWSAPYFVFSRILKLPVVSGGLGHGDRQHVANEYMTVNGLRAFEKFVATFLHKMAA